jgi:hypothetical protein
LIDILLSSNQALRVDLVVPAFVSKLLWVLGCAILRNSQALSVDLIDALRSINQALSVALVDVLLSSNQALSVVLVNAFLSSNEALRVDLVVPALVSKL